MTMETPRTELTTNAVLTRLEVTGLLIGDGRKPEDGGWQGAPGQSEFVAYAVLYSLNHLRQGPDASLEDRNSDPVYRYQTNSVGKDRRQAERTADLVAGTLLNREPLDIPNRQTVLLIHETSTGVIPDESLNPPVFVTIDRWRIDTN